MGLVEFDPTRGKVLRFIAMPDERVRLFEDREGRYWIAKERDNGLALFDPETNTVTPYSFYKQDPDPAAVTGVMDIAEDSDGNLWLGSLGIGLLRLNSERNRLFHYGNQPQDPHSIAENKVAALFQDRDGNLWTGLHSAGVNYVGAGAQQFEVFRNIPGDPNSLTLNFVNVIFEDREGILWIGNDDGLNRIDRDRHIPQAFTWTRISSGCMSGIGISSSTRALPYSCMRAAFMSASFLVTAYVWHRPR
jgi:ligand-binding sensor domain-containing protein